MIKERQQNGWWQIRKTAIENFVADGDGDRDPCDVSQFLRRIIPPLRYHNRNEEMPIDFRVSPLFTNGLNGDFCTKAPT
jgi:hypothetical protein